MQKGFVMLHVKLIFLIFFSEKQKKRLPWAAFCEIG